MSMRHILHRLRGLRRDRRGVAAVEFAIILPLMVLLYVGVIDVTRGVIASRKLNLLSRTLSDLISQEPTTGTVSMTEIGKVLSAASVVMQPFDPGSLTLTLSAVDIKKNSGGTCCDALVRWSFTQSGTLRACTTPLTQVADGVKPLPTNFPKSLVTANQTQGYGYTSGSVSYVIVADASYTYTPFFSQALNWFASGMNKTTFMVPRSASGPVVIADPSGVASPQSGKVCFS